MNAAPMPLPFVNPGDRVRVAGFSRGGETEKRLAGMGVVPGCELQVMQREGEHLVVAVGHARLALGHAMAQKILVTLL